MMSRYSRRAVLALTGGGVAGLATAAHARGDREVYPSEGVAGVQNYQPVQLPRDGSPTVLSIAEAGGNRAAVVAQVPELVFENQPLIVTVLAAVPAEMVGKSQVIRVIMLADSGQIMIQVATPHLPITDRTFSQQVTQGSSHPIDDWGLVEERIFAVRASINVIDQEAYAVSPDFWFKVRRTL